MNPSNINITEKHSYISTYFDKINPETKDIEFNKSSFIESIILNLPLGNLVIDFNGIKDTKIIDGVSRIYSVKNFIENRFELENLKFLTQLNGKTFSELETHLQRKIQECKIIVYQLNFMFDDLKQEIITKIC